MVETPDGGGRTIGNPAQQDFTERLPAALTPRLSSTLPG
jgi:hypothetical protein